jgi:hypothetical protein
MFSLGGNRTKPFEYRVQFDFEPTTASNGGGFDFRLFTGKIKAHQCFKRQLDRLK